MSRYFDENMVAIGERLRRIREAKGDNMTIAHEIRARYGVKIDPSYLSRMERGKVEIPLRTLYALADYYQVQPGQLIDPGTLGDAAGAEFLLTDKELLKQLLTLKAAVGEQTVRTQISLFTQQLLSLLEEIPNRTKEIRAARPTAKKTKTSRPTKKGKKS